MPRGAPLPDCDEKGFHCTLPMVKVGVAALIGSLAFGAPLSDSFLSAIQSPFPRLRELLENDKPGTCRVDRTIGEPKAWRPAHRRRDRRRAPRRFCEISFS